MDNYAIYSVGDSCLTLTVGNDINEIFSEKVIAIQRWFILHPLIGLKDVLAAYNSVSILYDPLLVHRAYRPAEPVADFLSRKLAVAYDESVVLASEKAVIRIPVCYGGAEGPDLASLAELKQLTEEEVVRWHTKEAYRIYMIGFLPGFPYMASVPKEIEAPRKAQPAPVAAGSIGIAGVQTGIYPLNSPGGWQIIGKTPVKIFDPAAESPFLLQTGNYVQFYAITREEFMAWNP